MSAAVYLGFDFGDRRIGVAIGQEITLSARPLPMLKATKGVPDWGLVVKLAQTWNPQALIVGLPTCINGRSLYTTSRARQFASQLQKRLILPVHLVDERFTTVEARAQLFAKGGYRKIKCSQVDSIAASIILAQWLNTK